MDRKIISTNPANDYEIIGKVDCTPESAIPGIVKDSKIALEKWKNTALDERIAFVHKIAESLEVNKDELSNLISLEMGMPKNDSSFDVISGVKAIYGYTEQVQEFLSAKYFAVNGERHITIKEPLGVIFAIAPWNYPMGNFIWLCI